MYDEYENYFDDILEEDYEYSDYDNLENLYAYCEELLQESSYDRIYKRAYKSTDKKIKDFKEKFHRKPKEDETYVTRYGRPGLKNDDWVMTGKNTALNYFRSGKWQKGWGNQYAPRDSAETYIVKKKDLRKPSKTDEKYGIDRVFAGLKGGALFNQRKYTGKKRYSTIVARRDLRDE